MSIESKPHLIQFNKNILTLTKTVAGIFSNIAHSPAAIAALQELTRLIAQTGLGSSRVALNQELQRAMKTLAIPHFPPNSFRFTPEIGNSFKAFQNQLAPVLAQMGRSFQEMPPKLQAAVLTLGQHGWYLDMNMTLPVLWRLEKALLEGHQIDAEEILCRHFEGRLDDIEETLLVKLPTRAALLRSAFKAHREGEFNLSIPVLLAQSDGVCKDISNRYLFMKERGTSRPQTAAYVEGFASKDFMAAALSPLTGPLPVSASERQREPNSQELNRHAVMHGESLTYGTQINGLKAISLLNYLVAVLRDSANDELVDAK